MKNFRSSSQLLKTGLCWLAIFVCSGLMIGILPGRAFGTIDDEIASAVRYLLDSDKHINSEMIQVHARDAIVTLAGFADSILDRERGVEIAKTARGVRSVVNLINLRAEKRSDELIRKDLMFIFDNDPATASFKINTSVDNGIVTLSGRADSWQEKTACARIAKSVKGVRTIRTFEGEIEIRPESSHSDAEIKAEIRHLLWWDVRIIDSDIDVNVAKGRVTLRGSVGSIGEKTRVFGNAWVAGVVSVDDDGLRVKPSERSAMIQDTEFMFKSREEIKKAVEDALAADPRVTSENLQIVVDITSTVTLHGVVKNRHEKIAAEQDAENTIGVVMVNCNLKIQPSISADSMRGQGRNGERKR